MSISKSQSEQEEEHGAQDAPRLADKSMKLAYETLEDAP